MRHPYKLSTKPIEVGEQYPYGDDVYTVVDWKPRKPYTNGNKVVLCVRNKGVMRFQTWLVDADNTWVFGSARSYSMLRSALTKYWERED